MAGLLWHDVLLQIRHLCTGATLRSCITAIPHKHHASPNARLAKCFLCRSSVASLISSELSSWRRARSTATFSTVSRSRYRPICLRPGAGRCRLLWLRGALLGMDDRQRRFRRGQFHVLQEIGGSARLRHAAPLCTSALAPSCTAALNQSQSAAISCAGSPDQCAQSSHTPAGRGRE